MEFTKEELIKLQDAVNNTLQMWRAIQAEPSLYKMSPEATSEEVARHIEGYKNLVSIIERYLEGK